MSGIKSWAGVLLFCACAQAGDNDPGPTAPADYKWAAPAAIEAWHDMKFGLRIHWGGYAINGIGPESWPLNDNKANASFLEWYWSQHDQWNPKAYDPQAWIALMKRSHIKFFDFTTKHHEGFSMYDTDTVVHDCWGFDHGKFAGVAPCGPNGSRAFSSTEVFGRDITGELIAAAREGGVKPGLYFSHIDWYDADMRIDQWNPVGTGPFCTGDPGCDAAAYAANHSTGVRSKEWDRFVLRHRAQVLEVLTKYGEVVEMSFDMNFPEAFNQDMLETVMLAREVAPNTLFRGRGMGGYKGACDPAVSACGMGDYETPEEQFPDKPLPGNWQVIYHGSNFMSFDPDPANYQNGSFIVWHLVDIVSKGGLMQIGYGPDANGEFHPKAVEALEYAGRWLDTNGESIFSTVPMADHWNDTASSMVRYTRTKAHDVIYATVLSGFGSLPIPVHGKVPMACVTVVDKELHQITILGYEHETNRQPKPVSWVPGEKGGIVVTLPDDLDQHPAIMKPGLVFKFQGFSAATC